MRIVAPAGRGRLSAEREAEVYRAVLDEVETIQRMNVQTREKSLNALRQLMDMLAKDELPGLYLVITGILIYGRSWFQYGLS